MTKLIILAILTGTCAIGYNALTNDIAMYKAESQCVSDYIQQGHERIDIATGNGKCQLKRNGYYQELK